MEYLKVKRTITFEYSGNLDKDVEEAYNLADIIEMLKWRSDEEVQSEVEFEVR